MTKRTHRFARQIIPLLLVVTACSDGSNQSGSPRAALTRDATRHVTSYTIDDGADLAAATDLAVVGNYLVLLNTKGDSAVRVYDARTDEFIRSFGREGAGPGEFRGAWSLDSEPGSESAFWIFDIALQRLTRIDLASDFEPGSKYGGQSLQIQGSAGVVLPVWIGDTLLASTGFFSEGGRLAHIDRKGRILRVVGDSPPGDDNVPMPVRQHAYQSTVRPNSDRTLLAVATRHADRLEILRSDGRRVAAAERQMSFEPVYRSTIRGGQAAMDSGDELRFGYIDLATTASRIYALYSGRKRADFPGEANFGEYVHVFDWNANLIEVIRLDAPAITIEADEARQKLYAVRHHPQPALMGYDLRSMASAQRPHSN